MKDEIKDLKCLGALGNLQSFAIDGTKGSKIVDINVNIVKNYITNLQDTLKDREEYCYGLETQLTNLQEENKRLKENAIHNDKVVDKAKWNEMIYKSRNEKAIEFIKEKISSTKGVINDYMYHKDHNKILIELLQEDIELYKKELNILNGGDDNE